MSNYPLYGAQSSGPTIINSGGSIRVGDLGNWAFTGNVTSADKGNNNAPTATGRTETITFTGTGTYSGAATTAGSTGFVVDGYAAASGQAAAFTLPTGNPTTAFPVMVPAGTSVTAAYFDGLGSTQSTVVLGNSGTTTTEYSPYFDMPGGIVAGSYSFAYPGFPDGSNSALLSSSNTSANGTTSGTTYSMMANVGSFGTKAASTTATLAAAPATEVYFATSGTVLPLALKSFTGVANGCTANLAWETATELNSSYYGVEAGLNGSNFSQVAKVNSRNSATGASYTYAAGLGGGTTFFRLRAVDKDGKFSYSPVVGLTGTAQCGIRLLLKVSPNPAINMVNIQNFPIGSTISLLDINGRTLTIIPAQGNNQSMDINLSMYAKGVYLLHVQAHDGSIMNIKFIKQ